MGRGGGRGAGCVQRALLILDDSGNPSMQVRCDEIRLDKHVNVNYLIENSYFSTDGPEAMQGSIKKDGMG